MGATSNMGGTDLDKGIVSDFSDPFTELVYLLNQGAGLEHSLMLSYLYCAFSIKDEYAHVRGQLTPRSYQQHSAGGRRPEHQLLHDANLLEVCIEEMQHLSAVNEFLVALGCSPNVSPNVFPFTADIYPFAITLLPLDRYVAATFMWLECNPCTLGTGPGCEGQGEPPEFKKEVCRVIEEGARGHGARPIDDFAVSHLGSLYEKIVSVTQKVASAPPKFIPKDFPWEFWVERTHWLLNQGEVAHYRFFRSLFTGEAFGSDATIWSDPHAAAYPAHRLKQGTAFRERRTTIPDEDVRQIAWLSNLHLWIVLTLLDTSFRWADPYGNHQRKYVYKAVGTMTGSLWALGLELARRGWGIPFDQLGTQYAYGRTEASALQGIQLLILEARELATSLGDRGLLPADYDPGVFAMLLDGLLAPPSY